MKESKSVVITDILELEQIRVEWSLKTFSEATATSSICKAKEEIKEIEENIRTGFKDPVEYADAIMCLFDAAAREGIDAMAIMTAYNYKIIINKRRKWKKNPDNSYSHIKE